MPGSLIETLSNGICTTPWIASVIDRRPARRHEAQVNSRVASNIDLTFSRSILLQSG